MEGWPKEVNIVDPSHISAENARTMYNHWLQRQKQKKTGVFKFVKAVSHHKRELEKPLGRRKRKELADKDSSSDEDSGKNKDDTDNEEDNKKDNKVNETEEEEEEEEGHGYGSRRETHTLVQFEMKRDRGDDA
jgi:hypothetical protein